MRSRYFSAMFISESSSESESRCGLQAQIDQLGMLGVVVVLFGFHARVREVVDLDLAGPVSSPAACTMCASSSTENCSVNWLKTRHSPRLGGIQAGDFDAAHGVANIQEAARLPALAIHRERMPDGRLHAKAVQHRAENFVVIEAIDQRFVQRHFVGHGAVHHALVQIGGAQSPDPAGEHDVVAVVHLGEVIEGAGLLGKRQHVLAAVVLDA